MTLTLRGRVLLTCAGILLWLLLAFIASRQPQPVEPGVQLADLFTACDNLHPAGAERERCYGFQAP
jgi:hypothetical protein